MRTPHPSEIAVMLVEEPLLPGVEPSPQDECRPGHCRQEVRQAIHVDAEGVVEVPQDVGEPLVANLEKRRPADPNPPILHDSLSHGPAYGQDRHWAP